MGRLGRIARRFGRDESGAFALMFGVMAIVLIALGGAVVDYVSLEQSRNRAQLALDAAALALQSEINKPGVTEESIRQRAEELVRERIGDDRISARVDQITIDRTQGLLYLGGQFSTPTNFVLLVGVPELSARFSAEVVRGALDIEIAVALDVTGSMGGQRITDLKKAIGDLVDVVVQDDQGLNYSKVALVPYAQAVNAGSFAEAVRGPIRDAVGITNISWSTGSVKTISAATSADPVVLTVDQHGFNNGDWVFTYDVTGMSQINSKAYRVANRTGNTFQLEGVDGRSYSTFSSGKVIKCLNARCDVTVTAPSHGFSNGQHAYITNVGGLAGLNNRSFQVANASPNTLVLLGSTVGGGGAYSAGTGRLHCTWQTDTEGCTYYRFLNAAGNWAVLPITNCVTERAINPFNDMPPRVTYAGRNYLNSSGNNTCLTNPIVPLTDDKAQLHTAINALRANGYTAGHLGILWSWYMLAPSFGYLWPFESRPADYDAPDLLKAAIIMTDGEFNTVHCEGVLARNSSTGLGSGNLNSCNAHNGTAYVQARAYCDAMKEAGVVVFTVGFGLGSAQTARDLMRYCASGEDKAFLAESGSQLLQSFQQIAENISALRLTR